MGPKRKGLALPAFGLPAWFNAASSIAVLASLVEYSLSTVPNLSPVLGGVVAKAAVFLRVAFGIEYALRVLAAPKASTYIRSFLGLVDLGAVILEFSPIKLATASSPAGVAVSLFGPSDASAAGFCLQNDLR